MLIISQDKQAIINFENMQSISIENPLEDDDGMFKIIAETDRSIYALGRYAAEERAKEILTQIVYRYSAVEMYKIADEQTKNAIVQTYSEKGITPYIFEMPK